MLGHATSHKTALWPLIGVLCAGWIALTFLCHLPKPTDEGRQVVRELIDTTARAYDYSRRYSDDDLSRAEAKKELLELWEGVSSSRLADDTLKVDWCTVCLLMAKCSRDKESQAWHQRAKTILDSVTPPGRAGDYYSWTRKALDHEHYNNEEKARLAQYIADTRGSWWSLYLAEESGLNTADSKYANYLYGMRAFQKKRAATGCEPILITTALVLFIPACRRLAQPPDSEKRSVRLQRLWPLGPTLLLFFGLEIAHIMFMEFFNRVFGTSYAWYEFYQFAGPNLAAIAWQSVNMGSYALVILGMHLGLSSGWGSPLQILGLRWRSLLRMRTWIIAIFSAAALICLVPWVCACFSQKGWGNPLLDVLSRWVFNGPASWQITGMVFGVVVGPLYEELVFRGYLFAACLNRLGRAGAVLVPAGLFAAGHAYSLEGTIGVLSIGCALGFLRLRTGSLAAPFLTHMCINSVLFFFDWLSFL